MDMCPEHFREVLQEQLETIELILIHFLAESIIRMLIPLSSKVKN